MGRRGALFGPLLFLTLPIVALQASTSFNDVVVASFATASAYFVLGKARQAPWRESADWRKEIAPD